MYNESQITSRSAEVKQLQWILILQCVKHNLESNKKKNTEIISEMLLFL